MVGRADDDEGRADRVGDGGDAHPASLGQREDDPGAPQRPADVQRRHGGQLVGHGAETARCAGVTAPPAVLGRRGQRVDVAGQHARRRHRDQREADQADRRPDDEGVAHAAVVERPRVVGPQQHGRGHDVVQQRRTSSCRSARAAARCRSAGWRAARRRGGAAPRGAAGHGRAPWPSAGRRGRAAGQRCRPRRAAPAAPARPAPGGAGGGTAGPREARVDREVVEISHSVMVKASLRVLGATMALTTDSSGG